MLLLLHKQQVNDLLMGLDITDSLHNYTYNCQYLVGFAHEINKSLVLSRLSN